MIRFDIQGLFQVGMKHNETMFFFRKRKTRILSQQKIACQSQLLEPGVGPTACVSTWSHAQCWLEPNRLRGGCVFLGLSEVEEVKYCPGVECRGKFGRDESNWVIGGAKISEFCGTCAKI